VERVLGVARLEHRACDVGHGWRVARTERRLRLVPPDGAVPPPVPGAPPVR
jgi:hypothetical protein